VSIFIDHLLTRL